MPPTPLDSRPPLRGPVSRCSSGSPRSSSSLDVVTKVLAVARLEGREPVELLGGAVYLVLVRNPGAAFSLATGYTWVLSLVAVAVVVVIVRIARRLRSTGWAVALGLVLGGALGNLADRIFRAPGPLQGHVVDVVSLFAPDGSVWPVFNLADSSIVTGGVLLVLLALTGRELDGTRVVRQHAAKGGVAKGGGRRAPGRRAPARTGRRRHARRPRTRRRRARRRGPTVGDTRQLPVPDGLDGMRVDAGLSRLLGLSRTAVATLAEEGRVAVDGRAAGKSDRLVAGSLAGGRPARAGRADHHRRAARGRRRAHVLLRGRRHRGGRQAGRGRRAPEPRAGRARPCSAGSPRSAYRVSTSGAAERQGIVHRLDVGTTGVMVVAKSEHAYSVLKRAFKERTVDKRYHAVVQGHPDPSSGTIDAPIDRHPKHDYKFAVVAGGRPSVTHYDTIEAFRGGVAARHPAGDRAHPPDPRAHVGAAPPLRGRPRLRRRPGAREAAAAGAAVAARPRAGLRAPGRRPVGRVHQPVPGGSRSCAGPAAGVRPAIVSPTGDPRGGRDRTTAAAGAGGVRRCVALLMAWYAGSRSRRRRWRRRPASVRLGPEAGEDVAAYLARLPATTAPGRGPRRSALVQFGRRGGAAGRGRRRRRHTPLSAVFRVPLPRVQTALRFVALEPGVPVATALDNARERAERAAAADAGRLTGRPRAVAAAEAAALAGRTAGASSRWWSTADRAGLDAVARRPRCGRWRPRRRA